MEGTPAAAAAAAARAPAPAAPVTPTPEALIAALPGIEEAGQWSTLSSTFKLVPLTTEVLQHLLTIATPQRAQNLCQALLDADIDSVGSLLTASRDISKSTTGFSAIGKLATIHANHLQDIAALRDKVSSSSPSSSSSSGSAFSPSPCPNPHAKN